MPARWIVEALDAYPAERFGSLRGIIKSISTDSLQDSSERWNFQLRVSIEEKVPQPLKSEIQISTGMTAKVNVITGERVLISYLFEPVVRSLSEGWSER
jgi:multidrug efflux pump subunit AcrA (membrane-fusion protein)